VASNDLNEHLIRSLKDQGARINVWGVGTQLATAYDQPALGGVYKLGALRRRDEPWRYKVKLSENPSKISTPGVLQVRRYFQDGLAVADALFDESRGIPAGDVAIVDPAEITHQKRIPASTAHEDLLVPVFRSGVRVYDAPPLDESRARAQAQLACFHAGVKRFENPHAYPAGVEKSLFDFKLDLVLAAKGVKA
jgi:nicotinate phosphoribosyltransferase